MTDAFKAAVDFVLLQEGGYVNDPKDPGGETKFGICKRAYPRLDIKALTRTDAVAVYYRDYWLAAGCDALPPAVAALHFDTAVNQGIGAAARILQASAGVLVDGNVGPKTLIAIKALDARTLVEDYAARRLARYRTTKNFDHYGKGWCRRLVDCLALCNTLFLS